MPARIVVTGGAGYIGSHVCVELLAAGADILVIDDFSNSSPKALKRVEEIAGRKLELLQADLTDARCTDEVAHAVRRFKPDGAVHLAGLKAVGESVEHPVRYYAVNIGTALNTIRAVHQAGAWHFVFSSSATVYGERAQSPIPENAPTAPANPYGRSKRAIEDILRDLARADPGFKIVNLRYFNPVGAHPSGRIGEHPKGVPNNLFPFMAQVAVGTRERLEIFGNDWPTRDGTGVRDYIHVVDLAKGHVKALAWLAAQAGPVARDINLGTGRGYSVLEAVDAFSRAAGRPIPHVFAPRRPGDVAELFADTSLAQALLDWRAEKSLGEMCADHWRWQRENPDGYS
jgi:UDP-glucose 4-epimerase